MIGVYKKTCNHCGVEIPPNQSADFCLHWDFGEDKQLKEKVAVGHEPQVSSNLGGNKYQILKRLNKEMEFIGDPVYYTDLTECEKHINKMPIEFEVMIYVERAQYEPI